MYIASPLCIVMQKVRPLKKCVNLFFCSACVTPDNIMTEIKGLSLLNLRDIILVGVKLFNYAQEYLPLISLKYITGVLRMANIRTN